MEIYINLLLVCAVKLCVTVRLNPLENHDKLQDINNQYIAEWQWESWPMKEETAEQDSRSPGARVNAALWKDTVGPTWYLFGGQPVGSDAKKLFSDVWKYSVSSRIWERVFPSQTDAKGKNLGKVGGMMTLRAELLDDGHYLKSSKTHSPNILLCGRASKKINPTTTESTWSSFIRRKKQDSDILHEESKSLAVY